MRLLAPAEPVQDQGKAVVIRGGDLHNGVGDEIRISYFFCFCRRSSLETRLPACTALQTRRHLSVDSSATYATEPSVDSHYQVSLLFSNS